MLPWNEFKNMLVTGEGIRKSEQRAPNFVAIEQVTFHQVPKEYPNVIVSGDKYCFEPASYVMSPEHQTAQSGRISGKTKLLLTMPSR